MLHAGRERLVDRVLPARLRLVRQAHDQVERKPFDPARAQPEHLGVALGRRMEPTYGGALPIDEALDSQADAVHAPELQLVKRLVGHLPRSALDGKLRFCGHLKLGVDRCDDLREQVRLQQRRRSPTKVDRVQPVGQVGLMQVRPRTCLAYLQAEPIDITLRALCRKDPGGEVAEATLRLAERDGKVQP